MREKYLLNNVLIFYLYKMMDVHKTYCGNYFFLLS